MSARVIPVFALLMALGGLAHPTRALAEEPSRERLAQICAENPDSCKKRRLERRQACLDAPGSCKGRRPLSSGESGGESLE